MGAKGRKHVCWRKGSILALVVIMIVILALIGWGVLTLGMQSRVFAAKQSDELVATAAADAGIAKVLSMMNDQLAHSPLGSKAAAVDPVTDEHIDGCESDVKVDYSAGSWQAGYEYGWHSATATGQCRLGERTINARFYYKPEWFGIGVKETIDMKVGATFSAPYGGFSVRTNSVADGAITLKAGITIPGDVLVGPNPTLPLDQIIDVKGTTVIQGVSGPAPDEIPFRDVLLPIETAGGNPVVWDDRGAFNITTNAMVIGSADPFNPVYIRYDSMQIQSATLQVQGYCVIYVTGNMRVKNAAGIEIQEPAGVDSSLVLYMGGNLVCDNGAGFDNLATKILADGTVRPDTDALRIFGLPTCTSMDLKAKGDYFFGYAYAPNAELKIYAKNEVSGAFTGKSLELLAKTNFTYIPPDNGPQYPVPTYLAVRWWEE